MAKSRLKDFAEAAKEEPREEVVLDAEVLSIDSVTTREAQAMKVVRANMMWSAGFSLLPVPFVDMVVLIGIQVRMLQQLSRMYEMPFTDHQIKYYATALVSGIGSTILGNYLSKSALRSVPLVGPALGVATVPLTAAAISYAVGRVFIQHFESGGTLFSFDPVKMHRYFKQHYQEGLSQAADMNAGASA